MRNWGQYCENRPEKREKVRMFLKGQDVWSNSQIEWKMKASDIRELLKITDRPEMISFAGGLPAPELFPVGRLKGVTVKVLESCGPEALQYSPTEGFGPLRMKIAERMNKKYGMNLSVKHPGNQRFAAGT